MTSIVGIDVGTTTIKISRWLPGAPIGTERVEQTPPTPRAIASVVERLMTEADADVVALSSFRRALVFDDESLVLARSSPAEPLVTVDGHTSLTDVRNRLAPIHRWREADGYRNHRRFCTFDVWLAERLTGQPVVAESQAWLTGMWNTSELTWDLEVVNRAGVSVADLPEVLTTARIVGGVCLPILGDHEATAVAAQAASLWPLRLLECGTAMACMIGTATSPPDGLGLESPSRCGYLEVIDPFFARRVQTGSAPPPAWMTGTAPQSAGAVALSVLLTQGIDTGKISLCGGNATQEVLDALLRHGFDATIHDELTSSAGAVLVAEHHLRRS